MTDTDFLMVIVAKLVEALERKGTEQDGNWGYPMFKEELAEIKAELQKTPAVRKAGRVMIL